MEYFQKKVERIWNKANVMSLPRAENITSELLKKR